jgi:hypothetical protein
MRTFTLNDRQTDRLNQWIKLLNPPDPYEEDCCGSSDFEYCFRPSGIGDTVKVRYGKQEIDLTLDDDGLFVRMWADCIKKGGGS